MKNAIHKESILLEAMMIAGLFHGTALRVRNVFEATHAVAETMRYQAGWDITKAQADAVAGDLCERIGL